MKFARIAVLAIAVIAGGMAALLVGGDKPPPAPQVVKAAATSEVLVATADIPMGQVIAANALEWRAWPEAGSSGFITRTSQPGAMEEVTGSIARQPIVSGEPIRMQKIVKADGSGFMAAILPAGMRAVATEISAETGAGGFILPNDRVDVILTRKEENRSNNDNGGNTEQFSTSTILTNVRVLAIDQAVAEKDGEKVAVGRVATLELLPRQAEILALARQLGTLSLTLRALVDANPNLAGAGPEAADAKTTNGMTVIRFGVTTNSIER
jgi:pilus assembly protein CpaB